MLSIRAGLHWGCLFCFCLLGGVCVASEIQGKITAVGMKSAGLMVVYIDAMQNKAFEPPTEPIVIDQRRMSFMPHILAILKGTTVDFWNHDSVTHGVLWPSIDGNRKLRRDLGAISPGEKKSFTFNDLGVAPLLCALHPEMSGYIVVLPTPYYAVTDDEGTFVIKDVPPDKYTLKTWSEAGETVSHPLEVTEDNAAVNITVHRRNNP